ncbi:hypothetical protein AB0K09_21395 [Streptomyces sp. NPDC049577]|uniref:hypothetical protein n=1 Tax=Streptomyces sp. NPDC049577 TaxID=3155153 RepID=UPI0034286199
MIVVSPLKHRNLNLLGRYSFTAGVPASGALRPLRDPERPSWMRTRTTRTDALTPRSGSAMLSGSREGSDRMRAVPG